jgi:hypothetical protein
MKGKIGHVYLLSNPALVGIIKIGHTKRVDVELRASELSSSTSIPLPFQIVCSWLVENPLECEMRIHNRLAFCRISKDREFFRINSDEAEKHVNLLLYGTEAALRPQLESMVVLYRKYPDSFRQADALISKIEAQLNGCLSKKALDPNDG